MFCSNFSWNLHTGLGEDDLQLNFGFYLLLKKDVAPHLKKLEFSSPKRCCCLNWPCGSGEDEIVKCLQTDSQGNRWWKRGYQNSFMLRWAKTVQGGTKNPLMSWEGSQMSLSYCWKLMTNWHWMSLSASLTNRSLPIHYPCKYQILYSCIYILYIRVQH